MTEENEATESIIEFSEDIGEAEAPELLPENQYRAVIVSAESAVSQSSGNKYAKVRFRIPTDEFPPDFDVENAPDGLSMNFNLVTLEDNKRARHNLRNFCTAIGATASRRIDLKEWVGLEALVTVKHGEWNNQPREEIARVDSAD